MKTLGTNNDNDIYIAAGQLVMVSDEEAQQAIIEAVLRTQQGELQFDEDAGVDYMGTVFLSPLYISFWEAQVKGKVEALDFVEEVEEFEYEFSAATNTLIWNMTVRNTDGNIIELKNRKTTVDGAPGVDVKWNDIYGKPDGIEETLSFVETMRNEAQDYYHTLGSKATLQEVKNVLNRVVFDPSSEEYSNSRLIKFEFNGVPLGVRIDFSNLIIKIANTGEKTPYYAPYEVIFSDGTTFRPTSVDNENELLFPTGTGELTSFYTVMNGGKLSVTIRGNIEGILSKDRERPIILNSDGGAFLYLTAIEIGERVGLKEIGSNTFYGYKNLQQITWGNASTNSIEIGGYAFAKCSGLKDLLWLPSGITDIGEGCFSEDTGITNLKGLEKCTSLTAIPKKCFYKCMGLESLAGMPQTIAAIGDEAFKNCEDLKSIDDLSAEVTSIGEEAFLGCNAIETFLYMPDKVTTIGKSAFEGCTALRSLYIADGVVTIGARSFANCHRLTNILSESTNPPTIEKDTFDEDTYDRVMLYVRREDKDHYREKWGVRQENIDVFGVYTFGMENIGKGLTLLGTTGNLTSDSIWSINFGEGKELRFENSITTIPGYTYEQEYANISIVMKGFIKELRASSEQSSPIFTSSTALDNECLTSFAIENLSLEKIGDYTFARCTNLSTVSIENPYVRPYRLGEGTFYRCIGLKSLEWLGEGFGETEESLAFGSKCFQLSGIEKLNYKTDNISELPSYCFAETQLKTLNGLGLSPMQKLGEYCFYHCTSLNDISALLETGIIRLPNYCFAECTGLQSLHGIENIQLNASSKSLSGTHIFYGCTAIQGIDILETCPGVQVLNPYMFANCIGIISLKGIEVHIKALEEGVFDGCTGLTSLKELKDSQTPITVISKNCFSRCSGIKTLEGCEYIEEIKDYGFADNPNLLSTSGLGIKIKVFGEYVFQGCTGLQYISCPAIEVPTISSSSFEGISTTSIPFYVSPKLMSEYQSQPNWMGAGDITSRTISVTFNNMDGFSLESLALSKVIAGVKGDSTNSLKGVWFVDFGDGNPYMHYGNGSLHEGMTSDFTYPYRGNYTVTLYGDIIEIESPENHRAFLDKEKNKALEINVQSAYLSKIGRDCFRNYGMYQEILKVSLASTAQIGQYAFAKDEDFIDFGKIEEVSVCGAEEIGDYAFRNNKLKTSTGFRAAQSIGGYAFEKNKDLETVEGFANVKTIGAYAFANCTSLKAIEGLRKAQSLGTYAFSGCTNIEEVADFGTALTRIYEGCFAGCEKIGNLFMAIAKPPTSNGVVLAENTFEDNVYESATLYVPMGSEETYKATDYWSKFQNIKTRAIIFTLSNVTQGQRIPEGMGVVTATGPWTISYGDEFTKQYEAGTSELPAYTFQKNWTEEQPCEIKISGPITGISCTAEAYPIFGSSIGKNPWLTKIEGTESLDLVTLGTYTFAGCSRLKEVKSLTSVTKIQTNCFLDNKALVDISGLSGTTTIGAGAFRGCSSLESLYGLSKVITIDESGFYECTQLKTIDGLGTNISEIGGYAFARCGLKEVQMFASIPPQIESTTFDGIDLATTPLYVRKNYIETYRRHEIWGTFSSIESRHIEFTLRGCPSTMTIKGEVGGIESSTYWVVDWDLDSYDGASSKNGQVTYLPEHLYSNSGNHTILLEGDITSIRGKIASEETNEVGLPTSINGESFLNLVVGGEKLVNDVHCLYEVKKAEGIKSLSIGEAAFLHNGSLTKTSLEGVQSIGKASFAYSGIDALEMLEKASKVYDYAFFECKNVYNVTNLSAPKIDIGEYAFAELGELKEVHISISNPKNATITDTSFGYYDNPEARKQVSVYVPMGAEDAYRVDEQWGRFSIVSQYISFTLTNLPNGTTILGQSPLDSVGTARVVSNGVWSIDWGDGSKSMMEKELTSFPAHTYQYVNGATGWETKIEQGQTVYYRPKTIITISGDIKSIGCQSINDSPFITTEKRAGNPYLTRIDASPHLQHLTSIGDYAFQNCDALVAVSGFSSVETIGQYAFSGCSQLVDVGDARIESLTTGKQTVDIEGVSTEVETSYAVLSGSGFLSLVSVGKYAFSNCKSLASLYGFPSVLSLGIYSFENCISLTGITGLGLKYKNVSPNQFTWVDNLSASFGAYAFSGCDYGAIDIENYQVPPSIQSTTFPGNTTDMLVFVSSADGVVDAYKTAPVWMRYFENIISASAITITIAPNEIKDPTVNKEGEVIFGTAIYGGNGQLAFEGNYVHIDWGDGTNSITTEDGSDGWTFPSHAYTKPLNGSSITLRVRGRITRFYTTDANDQEEIARLNEYKPFLGLSTYRAETIIDEETGLPKLVTQISDDRENDIYNFKITSVEIGNGTLIERIGSCSFQKANIGSLKIGAIEGRTVTIGACAFNENTKLETIISASETHVTKIGAYAFYNCTSLKDISIVGETKEIGEGAFFNNIKLTDTNSLKKVEAIGDYAFYGCEGLKSIVLPSTLKSVGVFAFKNCVGITEGIRWDQSTEDIGTPIGEIGEGAFYGCIGTAGGWAVEIPSSVAKINNEAFCHTGMGTFKWGSEQYPGVQNATYQLGSGGGDTEGVFAHNIYLRSYSIYPPITLIPARAFYGCTSLTGIRIPATLCGIGESAFEGCTGIQSGAGIVWDAATEDTQYYDATENTMKYILENESIYIGKRAFYGCTATTGASWDVRIPLQVKRIESLAFTKCGMTKLYWDANWHRNTHSYSIGDAGQISENGESLLRGVFAECTNLTSIPAFPVLKILPSYTFYGCSKLTHILYNGNGSDLTHMGEYCYAYCDLSDGINIGTDTIALENIPNHAFEHTNARTVLLMTYPGTIGEYAFAHNDNLETISIEWMRDPDPLEDHIEVQSHAFFGCKKLLDCNVILERARKGIKEYAFAGCASLTELRIPDFITSLGNYAFARCNSLVSVNIPGELSALPEGCFNGSEWIDEYETLEKAKEAGIELENKTSEQIGPQVILNAKTGGESESISRDFIPGLVMTDKSDTKKALGVNTAWFNTQKEYIEFRQIKIRCYQKIPDVDESSIDASEIQAVILPNGEYIGPLDDIGTTHPIHRSETCTYEYKSGNPTNQQHEYTFDFPSNGQGVITGDTIFLTITKKNTIQTLSLPLVGPTKSTSIVPDYPYYRTKESEYWGFRLEIVCSATDKVRPLTIGDGCFMNCTGLKMFEPTFLVENIPEYSFYNCKTLSGIEQLKNIRTIEEYAFYKVPMTKLPNIQNVSLIGEGAFCQCQKLISIVGLPNINRLPAKVFEGCKALQEVGTEDMPFPSSIKVIGARCFKDCSMLGNEDIEEIGNYVSSIGESCFEGCKGISEIGLFPNVTSYPQKSFYNCTNIANIKAATVEMASLIIGNEAFGNAENLAQIDISNVTGVVTCFMQPFSEGIKPYTLVLVPPNLLDSYKVNGYWKTFANIEAKQ